MNGEIAEVGKMSAALLDMFPQAFISPTAEEQTLSLGLYRLLARGEPVPLAELAETLHLQEKVVREILGGWPGVFFDEQGRVVGYWGLALPPMSHRFELDGRTVYTWCAWDSLFIPQLIQETAHVESTCPVTGERIRLTVGPEGIRAVDPVGTVMSFVTPDATKILENVLGNFCHYVHFFVSAEAGARWAREHPGTFILSIDEAYQLGRAKNEAQYGEVLERSR